MAAAYSVLRTPPCHNISIGGCCVMPAGVTDTQGAASSAYLSTTNPASLLAPPIVTAYNLLLNRPCFQPIAPMLLFVTACRFE
jgi:hypothetical protein